MIADLKLPPHIELRNGAYFNLLNNRWVGDYKIQKICDDYWANEEANPVMPGSIDLPQAVIYDREEEPVTIKANDMTTVPAKFMKVADYAKAINTHVSTVYNRINRREIETRDFDGKTYIDTEKYPVSINEPDPFATIRQDEPLQVFDKPIDDEVFVNKIFEGEVKEPERARVVETTRNDLQYFKIPLHGGMVAGLTLPGNFDATDLTAVKMFIDILDFIQANP